METHPIESLMKSTLENLKDMINVNTVVGDPIKSQDGTLIIPISKVSLGFASGGSDFFKDNPTDEDTNYPFGGGSGSGISVKPIAFLVIKEDLVRLLPVEQHNINLLDRLLDQLPKLVNMIKKSDTSKDKTSNSNKQSEKENDEG